MATGYVRRTASGGTSIARCGGFKAGTTAREKCLPLLPVLFAPGAECGCTPLLLATGVRAEMQAADQAGKR